MLMPTVGASTGGGGGAFTVQVTYPSLYGFKNGWGTITTSSSTTAYTIGGTAPFTFEAEYVSGDAGTYAVSPGATTKFAIYSELYPFSYSAVFRFKVTDGLGAIEYSGPVSIVLEATYGGGGIIA